MICSIARRSILKNAESATISKQVRLMSSLTPQQKRNVQTTTRRETDIAMSAVATSASPIASSALANRFNVTAEVTVSKVFPAGFGWQAGSVVAENNFGFAPDTAAFALTTGFGDGIAVMVGHVSYYALKKAVFNDENINMDNEVQTGLLLGSAAVYSGTLWQPLVDVLQGMNLSWIQVFGATWVGCGTAFYVGLRVGRTILSGSLKHIEEPTFENSVSDKTLSTAIGGASAFFVGTDAAYMPAQNVLIDFVGIQDGTPDLVGCAVAGSSTAMGFAVAQSGINCMYPVGKCWND